MKQPIFTEYGRGNFQVPIEGVIGQYVEKKDVEIIQNEEFLDFLRDRKRVVGCVSFYPSGPPIAG
jgi:hypothetical protein